MKILLANSERGLRGGELQTMALASGLRRVGCDVMIAARAGSPLSQRAALSIPCADFRYEVVPSITPLGLARVISRWGADILHAQTSAAHTHLWLARRLVADGPPLVVSRRVAFPISADPLSLLKYRTGVAHYLPISRAAAATLRARGVDEVRMTIVPSGVDIDAFRNATASREVAEKWGLEREGCVIGTVGAFEREKGHATLLRAAAGILRAMSGVTFILVGRGSLEEQLRREIERLGIAPSVRCVPLEAPLEQVLPLFDIFVLPSVQEGLSTALLAAMAAGLPVVASETGGIPEAVSSESALLVPPLDHEALASALRLLIEDRGLRERMGAAARARSVEFDIRRTVEKTLAVYERVLDEK